MTDKNYMTETVAMYGLRRKRTMQKTYKSNDPKVMEEWNKVHAASADVLELCREFADRFDAKPLFSGGAEGKEFYGLVLNNYENREDKDLWTKPTKQSGQSSRIRSTVKGKENKARLAELSERYDTLKPKLTKVSNEPLLKALGTNWGNVLFSGIRWFESDNTLYVATNCVLGDSMTEITVSEYEQALKLNKAA